MKIKFKKRYLIFILPVVLPIIYHIIYYIPAKNDFFVAQISIGELLNYTGTTIGSIFLFFTVYLTIRNTRKDSKIEKIRDAFVDYLSLLSPFFTVGLLKETDANEIYLTLKTFMDEENKKYKTLSLYLTNENKVLLNNEYESIRKKMLNSQFVVSTNLVFNQFTKDYSIGNQDSLTASINLFGFSVAESLNKTEEIFAKILQKYESDFF